MPLDFPNSPIVGQVHSDSIYMWIWDGEKWLAGGLPAQTLKYIIGCYVPGTMTANQQLVMHEVSKAITFPANFGPALGHVSQARGAVAATSALVISIRKATAAAPGTFVSVGSITVAAGSISGVLVTSGGIGLNFAAGDTLSLFAPATPDPTFANFTATLVAHET